MMNPIEFPLDDFESIDDIARDEGFIIDDDGHWIPIESMMEELDFDEDDDDGYEYDEDEFVTEEEVARAEGFYIDDEGDWVPMDD